MVSDVSGGVLVEDKKPVREKNFSDYNRELSQQIDPETGERVQLLTKKQYVKFIFSLLKEF